MSRYVIVLALLASSAELAPGQPSPKMVSDWYQRESGETIPRPAIFNEDRSVDCRGDGVPEIIDDTPYGR